MNITPKQEAFAMKYVECGNASEAYRHAYDVGEDTKAETVWKESHLLLADPKVSPRVMELQEEARERHDVTMGRLTAELEAARLQAMSDPKGAGAAVSAIMAKAKLHGLLVDKTDHTLSDGSLKAPTEIIIVDATEDTITAQNRED